MSGMVSGQSSRTEEGRGERECWEGSAMVVSGEMWGRRWRRMGQA